MATSNPIITSLPDYVEQNQAPLIRDVVTGADTVQRLTLQTGVKSQAAVNVLETSVQFGDGSACGWNEAGTTTFSQRIIKTGPVAVNMAFCAQKVYDKYLASQLTIAAGQESVPFEEKWTGSIVNAINEALDKAVWQGDTSSSDVNLKRFDGFIKILKADAKQTAISAGTAAIDAVDKVLLDIPSVAVKDDTVIFCAPEFLRKYNLALRDKNLYHFEPGVDYNEIVIPGSSVKLVAGAGLTGTNYLVAGRLSNMFYGCDLENSREQFDLWYSKDNREFRLAVLFNAGVQVAFPDEVVLGTIAAA